MNAGEIVDCVVNYFGSDDAGGLNRFFSYHVIGGPGPSPGGGVASVVLLAVHDEGERCLGCHRFHVAPAGGPAAAVEKALRHLDAYHVGDRLQKVQTALRRLPGGAPFGAGPARVPAAFKEFVLPGMRGQ